MVVPLPSRPFFGPFVRFHDYDLAQNLWSCSVLVIVPASTVQAGQPSLVVSDQGATANWPGFVLDTYDGWNFWRFNFSVQLTSTERKVEYWPEFNPPLPQTSRYAVVVPGVNTPLHWGFKSCDWFSSSIDPKPYGGHTPLWKDLMSVHASKPLHLLVGGGDQLYNDPIFQEVPELKAWLGLKDRHARENTGCSAAMLQNIELFYFRHYCDKFSQTVMADAYASIPQMLMWDDHDIFDGWGSYPDRLLRCDVFQNLYRVAERFYLLFQHHTNTALAESQSGLFGDKAYNFVKLASPECAFLGLDIRARRTVHQVITPSNYQMIFERMNKLPGCVKHLIVVSTVPMIYPEVPMSEQTMKLLSGMSKDNVIMNLMGKTGIQESVMKFDEPELLDDLVDHWTSGTHRKERVYLLQQLQQFAQERACRVTIISGDVHLACAGLFYTNPKMSDPAKDHRWMMNITSSAIVNAPPPKALVKLLSATNTATNLPEIKTREKMVRVFKGKNPDSDKLMGRRNWCAVTVPPTPVCNLVFELRCEHDVNSKATTYTPRALDAFKIDVPVLAIKPTKPVPVPARPTPAPMPKPTPASYAPQAAGPGYPSGSPAYGAPPGQPSGPPSYGGPPGQPSGPPHYGGPPGQPSGPPSYGGPPGQPSGPPPYSGPPSQPSGPPPYGGPPRESSGPLPYGGPAHGSPGAGPPAYGGPGGPPPYSGSAGPSPYGAPPAHGHPPPSGAPGYPPPHPPATGQSAFHSSHSDLPPITGQSSFQSHSSYPLSSAGSYPPPSSPYGGPPPPGPYPPADALIGPFGNLQMPLPHL